MAFGLRAVDSVELRVLVDNDSDPLSTPVGPWCANETQCRIADDAMPEFGNWCCGSLGFSLLVTVRVDGEQYQTVFDAGPTKTLCVENIERLKVDVGGVGGIVLSHGHYDHTLGTLELLKLIHQHRHKRDARDSTAHDGSVPVHVHPKLFVQRARHSPDGHVIRLTEQPTASEIEQAGGTVMAQHTAKLIANDTMLLTGEIARITPFEHGLENHSQWDAACNDWVLDPLVIDEQGLVLLVKDMGLVVITGCAHAGAINTIEAALALTQQAPTVDGASPTRQPVACLVGGLHLVGANEARIGDTLARLQQLGVQRVVPAHCTGWRAKALLVTSMPNAVQPSSVGLKVTLTAAT
jgi:7,8-dihydropterin-6-yl-methyl-4-(beta-D-ribofuranosyl)aminobenzene 5'-phosphate synthase